jgi:B-cell receptor-associated protein 31
MLVFLALIVPLPFNFKTKLFTFISESPIVAKLQYGMKVSSPNTTRKLGALS